MNLPSSAAALELWGGVECTINRVRDTWFDQCALSRHRECVEEDLQLFAELGLRTLRTAVLWEHYDRTQDWKDADRALLTIERLGIRPIVGLLHHGSGPFSTDLLDPDFPHKLRTHALRVAERYPWVQDYTPVNEAQTTARFACLYGHWYPHQREMHSYVRALYLQVKAVALSMQAIRTVQPRARLIHTEDAGVTYAAPELEPYRIEREHRRWLGADLLCGRVDRRHALFAFLVTHGLTEREILWFQDHPCPPDILGLNYYVTSDRFLDHRVELYPSEMEGGDTGAEPLVDVEAVRIRRDGIAGAQAVLTEAWNRYQLPVAITEAHLGCEPEEQVRWFAEVWRDARRAQAAGVDVRAVTSWGLLGLFNWNNLCTRDEGSYEAGAFQLNGRQRVRTPLGELLATLMRGEKLPAEARVPGWWRQDTRLTLPPDTGDVEQQGIHPCATPSALRTLSASMQ